MKHLSKSELMTEFLHEVEVEKKSMARVVTYIREIDSRRLYLDFNCTSLYQFLTEHVKYSGSAAQRRIDAARLLRELPQIVGKLETGEMNLTQASQISRLVREKEKTGQVDSETKAKLVEAVKNQNTNQTEQTVCWILEIGPMTKEKARAQADESVRREVTFTKEEEALFQRVRELMSQTHPTLSFKELAVEMAKAYIKTNDPDERPTAAAAVKTESPRYIPSRTRLFIFQKQKHCQHVHSDGTKCCSRFKLEIDHITPVYKGGTNDPQNLQLLCDAHNRQKYREGR